MVKKLRSTGFEILLERGAGVLAGFLDEMYADAGASLVDGADLTDGVDGVVRVGRPTPEEIAELPPGIVLIGFLQPLTDEDGIRRLQDRGVVAFAMESIPRITRAQSMDALSSQATVAGYKGVLLAADRSPKLFPMLMTAAGTIAPARVLVLGAGVAGLQAIATARRLGAVVSAFDVRPAVAEQVESLGAAFLDLGIRGEETEGGYARELTPEQQAEQQRALEERIPDFDVVITTAAVPGRPAPRLIPASAVDAMRPGSVVVDLAADTGGNCELTSPGHEIAHAGVTIVGFTNVPSLMPQDASRLYARNVVALLEHLAPGGELGLDFSDEITSGACVAGRPAEATT
jgi:NAD(P) transhydrogenase subunit alpha